MSKILLKKYLSHFGIILFNIGIFMAILSAVPFIISFPIYALYFIIKAIILTFVGIISFGLLFRSKDFVGAYSPSDFSKFMDSFGQTFNTFSKYLIIISILILISSMLFLSFDYKKNQKRFIITVIIFIVFISYMALKSIFGW